MWFICKGRRGRPKLDVTEDQLVFLIKKGFTAKEIASQLGCSSHYIYKFAKRTNHSFRKKYSAITSNELDAKVAELHEKFPRSGSVVSLIMM